MNTLLKFVIFLAGIVAADIINSPQPNVGRQETNNYNLSEQSKNRKLYLSPYLLNTEYSANKVGSENDTVKDIYDPNNPMPFQNAPIPAFGLGGMMPQSLGLTNMPYNYMYGSAMMNPLNPMNGAGAMSMGAMSGMNPIGGMDGFNGQNNYVKNGELGFAGDVNNNGYEDELANPTFNGSRNLVSWGELPNAQVRVGSYCQNTQKQAVEIANAIMKRQNRIIFKELMNYLLKSKYLIGMTEVKLTRVLRKKIYGLMNLYSNINETNVQFIPVMDNYVEKKVTVNQNALNINTLQGQARRNLNVKKEVK